MANLVKMVPAKIKEDPGDYMMKKALALSLTVLLGMALLAGCGGDEEQGSQTTSGTSTTAGASTTASADVSPSPSSAKGETHDAGNVSALVPDGWKAFPFYSGGEESENTFSVHKGALAAMDIWATPGVQITFFPEGAGFGSNNQKDLYREVADLATQKMGDYTWEGFTAMSRNVKDEYVIPFAIYWTDAGSDKIQAIVWLEQGDAKVSVDDPDVVSIIASIKPSK